MKKVKIIAVITAALVLFGVYFTSAYALGDGLGALSEYFGLSGNGGGNGNSNSDDPDANDEAGTQGNAQVNLDSGFSDILQGLFGSAADAFSSSQITDILNNFDINALLGGDSDMLNEVMELIGANQPSTTKKNSDDDTRSQTPTQQNTVPQYTNVYVTDAPAVTYNYSGSVTTTIPVESTTGTGETTTLYYLTPSTVYAEQITTLPYDYQVGTTEVSEKDGITLKTIIGIAILLISGVAVVGVALSLKKSRV